MALEPESRGKFDDLLHQPNFDVVEMMRVLRGFHGENDLMAYRCLLLHPASQPR